MAWKADEILSGLAGGAVMRLQETDIGAVVELRGERAALEQLADLVERGEEARQDRLRSLSTGRIGYHLQILAGGVLGTICVHVPAPGIRTVGHLSQLSIDLTEKLGRRVTVLDWREIDFPPQLELATPDLTGATANVS